MDSVKNLFSERLKTLYSLTRGFVYDEKNEEMRQYLKNVITTAHNLVTEKIKDEDIDFDIYDIVVLITSSDRKYMREYLTRVNPENITNEDYISFNNALSSIIYDNSSGI